MAAERPQNRSHAEHGNEGAGVFAMQTAIARFLQYLTVERNASAYTIKSYRET